MSYNTSCTLCDEDFTNFREIVNFCCGGSSFHKECLIKYFKENGLRCHVCKTTYKKPKIYFAGKVGFHSDPDHISMNEWPSM